MYLLPPPFPLFALWTDTWWHWASARGGCRKVHLPLAYRAHEIFTRSSHFAPSSASAKNWSKCHTRSLQEYSKLDLVAPIFHTSHHITIMTLISDTQLLIICLWSGCWHFHTFHSDKVILLFWTNRVYALATFQVQVTEMTMPIKLLINTGI